QVNAIPVKIGVYYCFYRSSKFRFFTSGGIGYYFSNMSEELLNRVGQGYRIQGNQEAKGEGIGFHGGMGFELDVAKSIAFVVEGYGRYAKIKGFKGEKSSDSSGVRESMRGSLYYYELYSPYGWYPCIGIFDEVPGGVNRRNVREAALDFSGFTVRIGVKIRLF
ncbi:MAG: hypothetical protein JSV88_06190, partial [Candidatus Aminicenantes bacterium]